MQNLLYLNMKRWCQFFGAKWTKWQNWQQHKIFSYDRERSLHVAVKTEKQLLGFFSSRVRILNFRCLHLLFCNSALPRAENWDLDNENLKLTMKTKEHFLRPRAQLLAVKSRKRASLRQIVWSQKWWATLEWVELEILDTDLSRHSAVIITRDSILTLQSELKSQCALYNQK